MPEHGRLSGVLGAHRGKAALIGLLIASAAALPVSQIVGPADLALVAGGMAGATRSVAGWALLAAGALAVGLLLVPAAGRVWRALTSWRVLPGSQTAIGRVLDGPPAVSDRRRVARVLAAREGKAALVGLLIGSAAALVGASGPLISATVITIGVETQVGTATGLPLASMLPASLEGLGAVALVYLVTFRPTGRLRLWCVVLIATMLLAGMAAQGSHALWYDERSRSLVLPWGIKLMVSFVPPVSGAAALHLVVKVAEGLIDTVRRLQALPTAPEPDVKREDRPGKARPAQMKRPGRRVEDRTTGSSRRSAAEVLESVRSVREALSAELHREPDDTEIATRLTALGHPISASRTRLYLAQLRAEAHRPEAVERPAEGVVG